MDDSSLITQEQFDQFMKFIYEFIEPETLNKFWGTLGTILVTLLCIIIIGGIIGVLFIIWGFLKENNKRKRFMTEGIEFEAQIIGTANQYTAITVDESGPNVINNLGNQQPYKPVRILGLEFVPLTMERFVYDAGTGSPKVKILYTHPVTRQRIVEHRYLHDYNDQRLGESLGTKPFEQSDAYADYNSSLLKKYNAEITARNLPFLEWNRLYELASARATKQDELDREKTRNSYDHDDEGYVVLTPPLKAKGYLLNDEIMFIQKTIIDLSYDWTTELE